MVVRTSDHEGVDGAEDLYLQGRRETGIQILETRGKTVDHRSDNRQWVISIRP